MSLPVNTSVENWKMCADVNMNLSHSLWGWSCLPQLVGSCYPTIRDAAQRRIWAEGPIISTDTKQWFAVACRKEGSRQEEDKCTWTHAHSDGCRRERLRASRREDTCVCSFMTPPPLSCIDGHSGCHVEAAWPAAPCCHVHQKQPWIKQTHTEGMGRKGQLRTCSIMVPCLLQLPTRWARETSLLSSASAYLYHQKIRCNNNSSLWPMQ